MNIIIYDFGTSSLKASATSKGLISYAKDEAIAKIKTEVERIRPTS